MTLLDILDRGCWFVTGGLTAVLALGWLYSASDHKKKTVNRLLDVFTAALITVAALFMFAYFLDHYEGSGTNTPEDHYGTS